MHGHSQSDISKVKDRQAQQRPGGAVHRVAPGCPPGLCASPPASSCLPACRPAGLPHGTCLLDLHCPAAVAEGIQIFLLVSLRQVAEGLRGLLEMGGAREERAAKACQLLLEVPGLVR